MLHCEAATAALTELNHALPINTVATSFSYVVPLPALTAYTAITPSSFWYY